MSILPGTGRGTAARKRGGGGAYRREPPPDVARARKLRREMSYPEVLLWQRLRRSPAGVRFRRQHPVGPDYAADFYCAEAGLVIEVDGEIRSAPGAPERDAMRDTSMRSRGLEVLRIPAREILADADSAADAVVALVTGGVFRSGRPSTTPQERRGPPPQQAGEDQ